MISLFSGITFLGSPEVVLSFSFVVILGLLFKRHFRYLAPFLFVMISSQATVSLLKFLVNRPRPLDPLVGVEDPFSFPSGHSSIAVVFYGALAFIINKEYVEGGHQKHVVWGLAILIALLIGVSRVYLRVHHVEDVVAGFTIGIFWLSVTYRLFLKRKGRA